jgi:glycerol-3-phosphate O-acyltransferase
LTTTGETSEAATPSAVADAVDPAPHADWPAPPDAATIVLAFASAPAERAVLDAWLLKAAPNGNTHVEMLRGPDARLEQLLADAEGNPWLVPVRVAWLPKERDGVRAATVTDLLSLTNPRRPGARVQARILRQEPDRCRVVAAEPATLTDLKARYKRRRIDEGFSAFVGRQAVLALERAERSHVGLQYKVPRLVVEDIEASGHFRERIAVLAEEIGRSEQDVFAEASGYLEEMVASHSRLAIDAWEQFGRWLSRAYSVEVDMESVAKLQDLSQQYPLAFLPSHRSYLDPLVLRSALYRHGFAPNHVLGGLNVGFWPIGPVARRSGVVFIRRSVRGEPVYKLVLREYIGYLARKRFNLEWYIEGGRTRTGKLRPPRYGLLNYLVDAFRDGGIDDVMLVPTSIVYDQLYEVGAMAAEEHGAQKTAESLSWLVGYARAQGRGFGKVRVQFGEPASLRDALGSTGREHAVERVAFEVCHRINRATPITETALVALALLGIDDRAMTLEEIRAKLAPLLEYIEIRKLPTTGDLDLSTTEGVSQALDALSQHGVATRYDGGIERVWSIGTRRHIEAAFYRNSVVHFLLNRAIAELVLVRVDEERVPDAVVDGWEEALRIRDVLKFEFFFARKWDFGQELREELELIDPGWEHRAGDPGAAWSALERAQPLIAPQVVASFLEAYLVVAERLAAHDPETEVVEKDFLIECLGVGHQYRLQHRLASTESISRELFSTGLKLAANRDLLDPGGEDLQARREEFAAEMRMLVSRVERLRELALARRI